MSETSSRRVILAAIDYSKSGARALDRAIELAGQMSAVLHVVNVPGGDGPYWIDVPDPKMVTLDEAAEHLRSHVEARTDALGTQHRALERPLTHVRTGSTAEAVARLAADIEADIVVVGTHGRRGLRHFVIGSVAEAVVRLAPCEVLVVRRKRIGTAVLGAGDS